MENPISHERVTELDELSFSQVRRDDTIKVQTHYKILNTDKFTTYEIKVKNVRKDGLLVELVFPGNLGNPERLTARLVGGINEKTGEHLGFIKVSPEDHSERLSFKNLKRPDGERMGKSMSTAAIKKITLVR